MNGVNSSTLKEKILIQNTNEKRVIYKFIIVLIISNLLMYLIASPSKATIPDVKKLDPTHVLINLKISNNFVSTDELPINVNLLDQKKTIILENIILKELKNYENFQVATLEIEKNLLPILFEKNTSNLTLTPFYKTKEITPLKTRENNYEISF